jgi:hypothetical protein
VPREPRDKPRRGGRIALIVLLVLVVLLIAADRIALVVAEHTVASQARKQLASEGVTLSGDPSVQITGFPFLTQVLAGHYDKIVIDTRDPAGRGVRMDSLDVTATGVNAPTGALMSSHGSIKADRVTGVGKISWASFNQVVDLSGLKQFGIDPSTLNITGTDDGHITIVAPLSVQGQTVAVRATGAVSVVRNVLHVAVNDVTAKDGSLPPDVQSELDSIKQQLNFDVPLPALPYHLRLDSVRTGAAGVTINASARGVVLGG